MYYVVEIYVEVGGPTRLQRFLAGFASHQASRQAELKAANVRWTQGGLSIRLKSIQQPYSRVKLLIAGWLGR